MSTEINPRPTSLPPVERSTRPASARSAKPAVVDPLLLLRALRRRWLAAILLGCLLGAGVGVATWVFLPPAKVTASRTLRMVRKTPSVVFDDPNSERLEGFKATQISLIRSRENIKRALRRDKVRSTPLVARQENPQEWLERELRIASTSGPEFVNVTLSGAAEDSDALRLVVDAVTDEYLAEYVEKERSTKERRLDKLKELEGRFRTRLAGIRKGMERFRVDGGTSPEVMAMRQGLASKELQHATQELTQTRREIRSLGSQILQMEGGKTTGFTVSDAEVDSAVDKEPSIRHEAGRLAAMKLGLERDVARLAKGIKKEPQAVIDLRNELREGEERLKEKKKDSRAAVKARLQDEKNRTAQLGIDPLKSRLNILKGLENLLVQDTERLATQVKDLNAGATKLEEVKYELTESESMLAAMHKKAEILTIELEAPNRVQPVDNKESFITAPNEQTRKALFAGVAGGVAFLVGAFGVSFLEMRSRRLGPPSEITDQLGLPVLGTLPYCKGGRSAPLVQRVLKEAVDGTRTMLLRDDTEGPVTVLMIASAAPGEGKTSLACHLAASIGRTGRRTLLIDGDLRKPDIHAVFGKANGPGLCAVLRGECTLSEALETTDVPGLTLLTAGHVDDHAMRELGGGGLTALLQAAEQDFDYILIDSSPLLAVSDALLVASEVDGVVIAALQGETRLCRLGTAAERLGLAGGRILGVIVNGMRGGDQLAYRQYARYLSGPRKGGKK